MHPLTPPQTRALLTAAFTDLGQAEMFFDSPTDFGIGSQYRLMPSIHTVPL